MSEQDFSAWLGRQEQYAETITPQLVEKFHATLDPHLADAPKEHAPLLIHWCVALPIAPMDQLGPDGHPRKGGFFPPIPLPRRMWASGSLTFTDDLQVGDRVVRTSTIRSIQRKAGKTGELWFVDVAHELSTERGVAIEEVQTIVYREPDSGQPPRPNAPAPAADYDKTDVVQTSPTRLFRYSAITFNTHRIHYDESYAKQEENYPGIVVHGPLQATLLAHLAARLHGRRPANFSYRGTAALIAGSPMQIGARRTEAGVECSARDENGRVTMAATASW